MNPKFRDNQDLSSSKGLKKLNKNINNVHLQKKKKGI